MEKTKQTFTTKMITEAGLMLALATVLSMVKLYQMPQGGIVTLASCLPIIFFSIRWGIGKGMIVGALFGMIQLLVDPYVIHPIQLILDYPLPYAMLGISAFSFKKDKKDITGYLPFIILSYVLMFISHYFSGIIFFAENAGELAVSVYSALYNSYIGVDCIIAVVVLLLLWKPLNKLIENKI